MSKMELINGIAEDQWTRFGEQGEAAFDPQGSPSGRGAFRIVSPAEEVSVGYRLEMPCEAGRSYLLRGMIRTEDVVSRAYGAVFNVRLMRSDGTQAGRCSSPPFIAGTKAWTPVEIRFSAPPDAVTMSVTAGISAASGRAWLGDMTLERVRDEQAVSPGFWEVAPASWDAPPETPETYLCATDRPDETLVREILKGYLGDRLTVIPASDLRGVDLNGYDAVLVYASDGIVEASDRLRAYAEDHLLVVDLAAYTALVNGKLPASDRLEVAETRGDDALYARVKGTTFITKGFHDGDVLPFWRWRDGTEGTSQRGIRRTDVLDRLGAAVVAESIDDGGAVALWHSAGKGGIAALDMATLDAPPRSTNEDDVMNLLLFGAMGTEMVEMGEYIAPFPRYDALADYVHALADAYPFAWVTEEGQSVGGLPIYSLNVATDREKPLIAMNSSMHAHEWGPGIGGLVFLKQLCRQTDAGTPCAEAILRRYGIKFIPVLNPDGWDNFGPQKHGVDLNRNFPAFWENYSAEERRWRGEKPLSEPEAQAVDRILREEEVALWIDFHETTSGTYWLGPSNEGAPYRVYFETLPAVFDQVIDGRYFYCLGGPPEQPAQITHFDRHHYRFEKARPMHSYANWKSPSLMHYADSLGIPAAIVEAYGNGDYSPCGSIQRTDFSATLIEQVIGLQFGLLLPNRKSRARAFTFPVLTGGKRLVRKVYGPTWDLRDSDYASGTQPHEVETVSFTLRPWETMLIEREGE